MIAFRYEAVRTDGATVKGTLDAVSGPDAAAVISERGLFPVRIEPHLTPDTWHLSPRPSARALATVFQSLASLVEAGVPLEKALSATERVTPPRGGLREAVGRARAHVREGASLSTALDEGGVFPPVTIGLVRAGERGAGLGAALGQAAAQLERDAETRERLRAALAYPLLLAVVGTLSVGLIVLFVVPRFAALLGDLGQALPPATRLLITLSDAARGYGWLAGPAVVAGGVVGAQLIRDRRAAWHAWLLGLPVLGSIRHSLATARVCRTLSALLGTGTPALAALTIAREAAGDHAVAERIDRARDRVAEGASLSAALEAGRVVTPLAIQLAAIGEGSGKLPALLAKAAELEERDAERRLKTLVGFLEPALIVAFAGLVAFVAAALLQAVYAVRPT